MALGADGSSVRSLVLSRVLWMTLAGGAIGMALAVAVAQAAKSLLYEVKGHDPAVLVGSVILLGVVALIAGFVPARRASRIDPMRALRYE
jgi:ABC-type antimicrobial peptide transport system permease subunit